MSGKAGEVDLEQRDVNDLNSHVKVAFEEILGEPDSIHSIDCVWKCSYMCFNGTLSCCYKALTVICAIPIAFCWGCEFACLACYHIWFATPYVKCFLINMTCVRKIYSAYLDSVCGPLCETCGLAFSRIIVKSS